MSTFFMLFLMPVTRCRPSSKSISVSSLEMYPLSAYRDPNSFLRKFSAFSGSLSSTLACVITKFKSSPLSLTLMCSLKPSPAPMCRGDGFPELSKQAMVDFPVVAIPYSHLSVCSCTPVWGQSRQRRFPYILPNSRFSCKWSMAVGSTASILQTYCRKRFEGTLLSGSFERGRDSNA